MVLYGCSKYFVSGSSFVISQARLSHPCIRTRVPLFFILIHQHKCKKEETMIAVLYLGGINTRSRVHPWPEAPKSLPFQQPLWLNGEQYGDGSSIFVSSCTFTVTFSFSFLSLSLLRAPHCLMPALATLTLFFSFIWHGSFVPTAFLSTRQVE